MMQRQDRTEIDRLKRDRRKWAAVRRRCSEYGTLTPAGKVAVGAMRATELALSRIARSERGR